ncbi:hypothetical protein GYMLUDRAFT_878069 [Collybiopsis luxurians FD-317 M1]|nr:hypothetical protein GYMLUDRAFT_878069 [Collybiopsis luxurians FD-317 M1]
MVEQVFFTRRYWQLTHNVVVTSVICIILGAHAVSTWVLSIDLMVDPAQKNLNFGIHSTIVAATLCAVTDFCIAAAMFHATRSIRTTYVTTQSLLHRITVHSVACGVTTSVLTIVMLCMLVTSNFNPFVLIFDFLGRVYTLTILVNLFILRKPVVRVTEPSDDTSADISRRHSIAFRSMNIPHSFTVPMELSTSHQLASAQESQGSTGKQFGLDTEFSGSSQKMSSNTTSATNADVFPRGLRRLST